MAMGRPVFLAEAKKALAGKRFFQYFLEIALRLRAGWDAGPRKEGWKGAQRRGAAIVIRGSFAAGASGQPDATDGFG